MIRNLLHLQYAFLLGFSLVACAPAVHEEDTIPSTISSVEVNAVERAQRAMVYFNQSRFVDAALLFHQVLKDRPNAKNIMLSLAASYERLGLPEEALRIYAELLAKDPQNGTLLSGKARALARAENYRAATATFDEAILRFIEKGDVASASDQAQSLSALAFRIGDVETAICYATLSQQLRPTRPQNLRLVRLLFSAGRTKEAMRLLAAISEEPGASIDPQVLFALSQIAFVEGNTNDARTLIIRALAAKPPDASDAAEIALFRSVIESALPKDDSDEEQEESENEDEAQNQEFIIARALYWPIESQNALSAMLEMQQEES